MNPSGFLGSGRQFHWYPYLLYLFIADELAETGLPFTCTFAETLCLQRLASSFWRGGELRACTQYIPHPWWRHFCSLVPTGSPRHGRRQCLVRPNSRFPLAWLSKRQISTSRWRKRKLNRTDPTHLRFYPRDQYIWYVCLHLLDFLGHVEKYMPEIHPMGVALS